MAKIDFGQIYDGVTLALHRAFPEAHIYGCEIKQDLRDGDFNVLPIKADHTATMGTRASRKALFDVIYYPSAEGGRAECLQIAHALPAVLGTVETPNGDRAHCLSFESTVEEDTLHCVVSYAHFVYEPTAEEPMTNIKLRQGDYL